MQVPTIKEVDLVMDSFQPVEDAYMGVDNASSGVLYAELENAREHVCEAAEVVIALDWFVNKKTFTPMQRTYRQNPWMWRDAIRNLHLHHLRREAKKHGRLD